MSSSALHRNALEALGTAISLNILAILCPPHTALQLLKWQLVCGLMWFLVLLGVKHYHIQLFDAPIRSIQCTWFKFRFPIRILLLAASVFILYHHATLRCIVIGFLTSSGAHTYFTQARQLRHLATQSLAAKSSKVFSKECAPKIYEASPARPPRRSVAPSMPTLPSASLSLTSSGKAMSSHRSSERFVAISSPFKHIEPPKKTPASTSAVTASVITKVPPEEVCEPIPLHSHVLLNTDNTSPPPAAETDKRDIEAVESASLAIHINTSTKRKHSSSCDECSDDSEVPATKQSKCDLHISKETAFSSTQSSKSDNSDDDHMAIEDISAADSFVNRMMTSLKRRFSSSSEGPPDTSTTNVAVAAPEASSQADAIATNDPTQTSTKRRKTSDTAPQSLFSGLLPSKRLSEFLQQHTSSSTALIPATTNIIDTVHQRPNVRVSHKFSSNGVIEASEQQLMEQHKRVRSNVTEKAQKLLKGALSQFAKPAVAKSTQPETSVAATTGIATSTATQALTITVPGASTVSTVPTLVLSSSATTAPQHSASETILKPSDSAATTPPVSSSPPAHHKKPPPSPSGALIRKKSLDHSTMGIAFLGKTDEKEHQHVLASLATEPFSLPPATISNTATSITSPPAVADTSSGMTSIIPSTALSGAIAASTANLPFGNNTTGTNASPQFTFGAAAVSTGTNSSGEPSVGSATFGSLSGIASGCTIPSFGNLSSSLGGGTSAFPLGTTPNAPKQRKKVTSKLKR